MMARIILFGSAVVGVLVVALAYAVWTGQYVAEQPSPAAVASAGAAPSAAASAVEPYAECSVSGCVVQDCSQKDAP